MRFALTLVVLLVACDPDYDNTAFRCDATHGCPLHQSCEFGRCRRGGAVGEVACGNAGLCTVEQQCCIDNTNPPRCIPAGDVCPGKSALCDGVTDCQQGDRCCYNDTTACGSVSCDEIACTDDVDCPSEEPHCCPATGTVWGKCSLFSC